MNEIERFGLGRAPGLLPPPGHEPFEAEFSLRDYLRQLRRNWRILFGTVVLVTGLTMLVLFQLTPRFMSTVVLVMEPPKSKVAGIESVYTTGQLTLEALQSERQIIRSRTVARKVVERLELAKDPEFNPALREASLFAGAEAWISSLIGSKETDTMSAEAKQALARVRLTDALLTVLTVEAIPRSNLLDVSVTSPDAEKATKIANSVAEVYLVEQVAAKFREAERATVWLRERIAKLRAATEKADSAVEAYRAKFGLIRGTDDKEITNSQIAQLSTQLINARTKRAAEEARLAQIEKLLKSRRGVDSATAVLTSPIIQRLSERETELIGRLAEQSAVFGPKHPKILAIRAEMGDLRRKIYLEVRKIVNRVRGEVAVARAHETALRQKLTELEGKVGVSNQKSVRLHALEREAKANRALLENVLARHKEALAQQGIQNANVRIVSYASVPVSPYFPKKRLLAGLAFFASLVVGIGLIALRESLDAVFRSASQVEAMTGVPVLDLVPEVKSRKFTRSQFAKHIQENPLSHFSEALRGVFLGLLTSNVDRPPKAVLVTSSTPEEGKSLLACALTEIVVASGPKNAVIVDCDLRRPSLHDYFEIARSPGLVEYLSGAAELADVVHHIGDKGLHVITAGRQVSNPSAVLASDRMKELLKRLRESYDTLIIDSAPVGPTNDARILGSWVDSILFAVHWGKTRRETAAAAIKKLQASGLHVAGIVLNRVDYKKHAFYDYSAYDGRSRSYAKYYSR